MVGGALAVWVTTQMYVHRTVRPVHAFRVAVVPLFSASTFLVVASYIDMNPWLLAPSLAVAYFGIAPLLDRRVLSCLRELVYAGSESDLNTRRDASETST